MRIAAIGQEFEHESIVKVTFSSDISLLDFDCVLWNPNTLIDEYKYNASVHALGYWQLHDSSKYKIERDLQRRQSEIKKLLAQNNCYCTIIPY